MQVITTNFEMILSFKFHKLFYKWCQSVYSDYKEDRESEWANRLKKESLNTYSAEKTNNQPSQPFARWSKSAVTHRRLTAKWHSVALPQPTSKHSGRL